MAVANSSVLNDVSLSAKGPVSWEEQRLWHKAGVHWRQLHGSIHQLGVSFEWHEFQLKERLEWGRSFHSGVVEICLNLDGEGSVAVGKNVSRFHSQSVGLYLAGADGLEAWREAAQLQRFVCVEFSRDFLKSHLKDWEAGLHPLVRGVMNGSQLASSLSEVRRLTSTEAEMVRALQRPPVLGAAQPPWYLGKALELAAAFFYSPPPEEELFCHRQQHVAASRVSAVQEVLRKRLVEPPSLVDLAKIVGCSPFYLSRTFSQEMGITIPQYLRQLRMEKAAELLRSGKYNVTEAAIEVGYNSLSHFSHAFHQTFGCCPGLYPVLKPKKN
jgi:AraC family transcriptional regulator